MSRSYGSSSPSRDWTTLRSGSIVSTLKKVWSSMPFSARIGVTISETVSMVKARPIGEQKWISVWVREAALAHLGFDQEATSSGAGGHL